MSGISDVYTYFRSIGLEGKEHDKWVTESLSLVPKPNLFQRVFAFCGGNLDKPSITKVMINLDSIIAKDDEDPESRSMATFIKGVLENLRLKRDPQLINLKKLNTLLASTDGLPNFKALVQKEYFSTGIVDNNSNAVRILRGPLQQLPQDIIARIFSYLCLKDRANAAATCLNWKRAEGRPDSLDLRAITREEMLYVSSLRDQTLKGIKENRAFIQAYKTCDFKPSVIASGFMNAHALFQYQPKAGDPILIRKQTSIYIPNTKKTIAHNFRSDYVLLYEKSINKIFAVDKEARTIHGLYEIDPETGVVVSLFEENTLTEAYFGFHVAYHDNEIWIITGFGSSRVYDRETKTLREENWKVKLYQGFSYFVGLRHINTIDDPFRRFEVIDIDNPQESFIVHNSKNCYFVAKTSNALYVSMGDCKTVLALDIETGETLKTFRHPPLTLLSIGPYAQVSNGILYLATNNRKTEAYDILTGKHVRSIPLGWFQEYSKELQVFDNKLVYPKGDQIEMMELAE